MAACRSLHGMTNVAAAVGNLRCPSALNYTHTHRVSALNYRHTDFNLIQHRMAIVDIPSLFLYCSFPFLLLITDTIEDRTLPTKMCTQ